jgi:NADH-quinone oxidoreductase subunit J
MEILLLLNIYISIVLMFFFENLIISTIYFIYIYINSVIIMLLYKIEFIGLIILLLYVGAISILIIFIVMMLNIRMKEKKKRINRIKTIIIELVIVEILLLKVIAREGINLENSYKSEFLRSRSNNYLIILGEILYTKYFDAFIILGIILLVALIGTVILIRENKRER